MALGDDWELRPNGDIAACPVLQWQTAVLPMNGLVRLGYIEDEAALKSMRLSAVQLLLSAAQARLLAQDLLKMADRIDAQSTGTPQ